MYTKELSSPYCVVHGQLDSGADLSTCTREFMEKNCLVSQFTITLADKSRVLVQESVEVCLQIAKSGPQKKTQLFVIEKQPFAVNIGIPDLKGYSLTFGMHPSVDYVQVEDFHCMDCSSYETNCSIEVVPVVSDQASVEELNSDYADGFGGIDEIPDVLPEFRVTLKPGSHLISLPARNLTPRKMDWAKAMSAFCKSLVISSSYS